MLETGDKLVTQTEARSRRFQKKLFQIISETLGRVVRLVLGRVFVARLEKRHGFVRLNGVLSFAGILRSRLRARCDAGTAVAPRDERILIVVQRVEGLGGLVAHFAAQPAVLLLAVVAPVAEHVGVSAGVLRGPGLRRLLPVVPVAAP